MFREGFVNSAGVRLHYLDWGGSGRPMVLLAGLGSTAHIFRELAPRLRSRHRVLALTRRGHGRSDRPESGYDLDTLVSDIHHFLDEMGIDRPILVGHSFGGVEMPLFAKYYPARVESIVFLDAVFPRSVPVPDLSGDPTWSVNPTEPATEDMASRAAYMSYYQRFRPDLARILGEAVEADVMEYITIKDDESVKDTRDNELLNGIYVDIWSQLPEFSEADAPMLAIVPDGDYHPSAPLDATVDLCEKADQYWMDTLRPWIRARTSAFQQEAPQAQIVTLDSPNHHIFIDKQDATVQAMDDFLGSQ
ncbi:MAG: alpha/beta hydrolase [Candidatus Promineifilaceae bacterium]